MDNVEKAELLRLREEAKVREQEVRSLRREMEAMQDLVVRMVRHYFLNG